MIEIWETSPPIKQSGKSSFMIFMPHNVYLTKILQGLGQYVAYEHKKIDAWEIPVSFLSRVLDEMVFYDEIELHLLPEQSDSPNCHDFDLAKQYFPWLPECLNFPEAESEPTDR